jgi:Domain of unknown function (DUF4192)
MSTQPISDSAAAPTGITVTEDDGERRVIRVTSPAKVLNLVPHLVGFHPDRSMVVIGMEAPRTAIRVTVHYPLPDVPTQKYIGLLMEHVAALLHGNSLSKAMVVGYGPDELITPCIAEFRSLADSHDIELLELLRVEHGRYWSCTCTNPECCPADGTSFVLTADPEFASLSTPDGVSGVLQNREALAAQVAPVSGAEAAAMRRVTRQAAARAIRLLEQAPVSADEPSGRALLVREGITAMKAAIQRYHDGGDISRGEAAWLTVSLRDVQIRDDAWSRLDAEDRKANLRLLLDLTRLARRGYVVAPATLLAFVAWQCGNGALANVALDRAWDDDPRYSLAHTIREAVNCGARASLARMPMTPEQVAEAYAMRDAVKGQA